MTGGAVGILGACSGLAFTNGCGPGGGDVGSAADSVEHVLVGATAKAASCRSRRRLSSRRPSARAGDPFMWSPYGAAGSCAAEVVGLGTEGQHEPGMEN